MSNYNILDRFLDYKTNYFSSITEFINKYKILNKMFFNVFHCNIRSMRNRFDELLLFLQNDVNNRNLGMIVVTEIRHDVKYRNFSIPGYQLYFSKIKRNQNDGVMIYVNDQLCLDRFFEYEYVNANILKVVLKISHISLCILCIYRSPSGDRNEFSTNLNSTFTTFKNFNGKMIIIGDINLNIVGNECVDNEYLDTLSENGFKSFINVFTRTPMDMRPSCLDHIFIKNVKKVKIVAGVLQINITNQFSIILSIENEKKTITKDSVKIITYKKLNEFFKNEKRTELFICND